MYHTRHKQKHVKEREKRLENLYETNIINEKTPGLYG